MALSIPELPTFDPFSMGHSATALPFPFDRDERHVASWFYLARAGVHRATCALTRTRKNVVMPSYHHGVEVEAVKQAGAKISFYRVDRNMQIDVEHAISQAVATNAAIIYVTHYVGFAQPIAELRAWCDAHEVALIEDCALALFSRDERGRWLGSLGDAAIFCLYKTLPVPHGGLLVTPSSWSDEDEAALEPAPVWSTVRHLGGLGLAHLALRVPPVGAIFRKISRRLSRRVDRVVPNVQTGTMRIRPGDLTRAASPLIPLLLARTDVSQVIARRRRNFRRLAEALADDFPLIGFPLRPGVCPLFLPVRVADKEDLHRALHAHGVYSVDFWSSGDDTCDLSLFPEVAQLRREVLELPCHQSLTDEDVDRMAHIVKQLALHADRAPATGTLDRHAHRRAV